MPMLAAAALDRSMILPPVKGPRSLIRTTTDCPLERFSTRTRVPNGNDRCAAVRSSGFIRSPLAVLFAGKEYQEAWPRWSAVAESKGTIAAAPRSPTAIILARTVNIALVSPYSVVWQVFETDEESSRPHFLCRAVTYGAKRPKIDSHEVIERRFGQPCPKTAAKIKTCLETDT